MKCVFRVRLLRKMGGSADGSGRFHEAKIAFRLRLPKVPGRFRNGSVCFATQINSHFAFRPWLPTVPARFRVGPIRLA